MLPAALRYLSGPAEQRIERLRIALGPRDEPPPMPVLGARAERAQRNLQETLPIFLVLALLHLQKGSASLLAERAALVFCFARVLYVPAYLLGVAGVRSLLWMVATGTLVVL